MPRPRSENPTAGELEVLHILWQRGPSTVRQVMEELNRTRKRAYTSVMSLLNVMTDKGLLKRKPRGRAFLYSPRVERHQTLRKMAGELVERAFEGSAMQLVVHALEQTKPSPEELDQLHQLIDDYQSRKRTIP